MKDKILGAFGKSILSIDIGSQNIKIVEGVYSAGKVTVNKAVTIPTPSDSFYDGQFTDKEKLEQTISSIIRKEGIKTKNISFTLESTDTISREIVLPLAKPQELEQIIGFEVDQYLPIEIDRYVLQHKIIGEFEEDEVKKVNILVVALPKSIAENYLDLGTNMGLLPHFLDTHSNAIHKLLPAKVSVNDSYPLEGQTIAAIDLGHQFINLTIINKGQFEFSRLLNKGGKDIDTNIANLFNLTLEEASAKKLEVKNINHDIDEDTSANMLTGIVKETIIDWLDEIQRIFRYYTSRTTGNAIDTICIYGGSSNIEGIGAYIQEFFNVPTFKIDGLNNVKLNTKTEDGSISSYINAIGAIMRR